MVLNKGIFVSLALAFAATACSKGDEMSVAAPGGTTVVVKKTEKGPRQIVELSAIERKELTSCITDAIAGAEGAFEQSLQNSTAKTTEEKTRLAMDAMSRAVTDGKQACATKYNVDLKGNASPK